MEISNVSGAYTSSKIVETDDEKETKKTEEEEAKEQKVTEKEEKDSVEISSDDFDEESVEDKASNYVANIIANPKLTEESKAVIQQYMATFDAARFIKMYGPFTSTAEISAAMYAVTSHMIKYQQDE